MFKSTLKLLGIVILLLASFIYTDRVTKAAKESDTLMREVINYKQKNDVKPVEPIISGDEVILGYSGISVNKEESYRQMKKINKFLEERIIYDVKLPNKTIADMYNYYIYSIKEYEEQLDVYSQSPYLDDITEKIEDQLDGAKEKLSEYKEQYRNYNFIILSSRATTILLWLAAIGYESYFILNKHNKENCRFKD